MEGQLHLGARPALACHPGNTGAVGMDVLERGMDSHKDGKQTGSENTRPCVYRALVEIDLRVEDVGRCQRVVDFEVCAV